MMCVCGHRAKVLDSRIASGGVRRRHECESCGNRFNTIELLVESGKKHAKGRIGALSLKDQFLDQINPEQKEKIKQKIIAMLDSL